MSNLGGLSPGKLVATANGKVTAHALATLQERGKLFITTGEVGARGIRFCLLGFEPFFFSPVCFALVLFVRSPPPQTLV